MTPLSSAMKSILSGQHDFSRVNESTFHSYPLPPRVKANRLDMKIMPMYT